MEFSVVFNRWLGQDPVMGWTLVPPKMCMLKSYPPVPHMWLYSKTRFKVTYLKIDDQVKMRMLWWAVIKYDSCSFKKRKLGYRQVQKQKDMKTERRRQSTSQGERPQGKPMLSTLGSWTSSLQNFEKIIFCWLGHSIWGTLYDSPSKLIKETPTAFGLP